MTGDYIWVSQGWMMAVVILACLLCLSSLSYFVDVFPSIIRCIFTTKEHENLGNSVSLSIDRNKVCFALFLPVAIITARFGLFTPLLDSEALGGSGQKAFWGSLGPTGCTLVSIAVLSGFILLRIILKQLAKKIDGDVIMQSREWSCVANIPNNFFILIAVLWIVSVLVMFPAGTELLSIRKVLLWELAAVYFLCLIHSTYFFTVYRNYFSAFLYLCSLEILPSGLLVLSAILL